MKTIHQISFYLLWLGLFCCPFLAHAQINEQKKENAQIQQNIENLSENLENENTDLTALTELFQQLRENPINLNTADGKALQSLTLLSEIQINSLLSYIEKNGTLISIYELQGVNHFDLNTIEKIVPFVYVNDKSNYHQLDWLDIKKNLKLEWVNRYQSNLELQEGYRVADSLRAANPASNQYYLGSSFRQFSRLKLNVLNNISAAFIADKDAGEEWFKGSNKKGYDFYSGHVALQNLKYIKQLIIGDYQASFGQGLTMWNGFGFGKTSQAVIVKRQAIGFRPYQSSDENRFFRGAATTLAYKNWGLNLMLSQRKRDANIEQTDTNIVEEDNGKQVSSILNTGLHNTNNSVADRNTIIEQVLGSNFHYQNRQLKIGITSQYQKYSENIALGDQSYQQFRFTGNTNLVNGIEANYTFRNMLFFGESSWSRNKANASILGLLWSLDPKLSLVASYRKYSKQFQNYYALAFSENTFPINEQGIYAGIEIRPSRAWTISAYADQFQFPFAKFNADGPSKGSDYLLQVDYQYQKKNHFYFRYRNRNSDKNDGLDNTSKQILEENFQYFRIDGIWVLNSDLKMHSRLDYNFYVDATSKKYNTGTYVFTDLIYKSINSPWNASGRLGLFDAPVFNNRIYAFENDVLYSFSIPAMSGKGLRYYFQWNYNINKHFEVWLRLARTQFVDRDVISAGSLNQINGNSRTEIKFQLAMRL